MKFTYHKILAMLLCISTFVGMRAQSAWMDENFRASHFPADEYYSAYYYKFNENGDVNKTIDSAIKEVQALLANSISSKVSSNSRSSVSSINSNAGYVETEEFYNDMKISSDAQLINVRTEYYYDEGTDMVHTFAYVKRKDLITFLDSHISSQLKLLDAKLKGINNLLENGYKKEANQRFEELKSVQNSLAYYISNLMTVDAGNPHIQDYSRQIEEYASVIKKINSDMSHNMTIYFESQLETPFKMRNFIPERCKGALSPKGFSFVTSPENADYIVTIVCTTRTSSVSTSTCYAFADVDVSIIRGRDDVNLYEDSFSIKGGALTEEKAHLKAMQNAPDKIVEQILAVVNE